MSFCAGRKGSSDGKRIQAWIRTRRQLATGQLKVTASTLFLGRHCESNTVGASLRRRLLCCDAQAAAELDRATSDRCDAQAQSAARESWLIASCGATALVDVDSIGVAHAEGSIDGKIGPTISSDARGAIRTVARCPIRRFAHLADRHAQFHSVRSTAFDRSIDSPVVAVIDRNRPATIQA